MQTSSTYDPWTSGSAPDESTGASVTTTDATASQSPLTAALEASTWTREDVELLIDLLLVATLLASLVAEVRE